MIMDFVIGYVLVGVFMGICIYRSSKKTHFPISGSREFAALAAACLIWPKIWWDDGANF